MQTNERIAPEIEELVRCYYPAVVRLALAILDDGSGSYSWAGSARDEAEDAAQDTFIAAARSLGEYRGSASIKTWLFSIAINTCRSRLRKRKAQRRLVQVLGLAQRLFGQNEAPEPSMERSERNQQLWSAVDRLDEKHRLVVLLRYVHELPSAEIADALGITEGTVHSRLHYARQQLAGKLRRSPGFEEAV
jgi:RNA polymerase sigma-70 factor (ECF subfamily)